MPSSRKSRKTRSKSRGTGTKSSRVRGRRTTAVQTIIISRDKFSTRREAIREAQKHGYKTIKVDEPARGTSFRFRQETPKHFARFITRELFPGATAVIGYYKPAHYKYTSRSHSRK